MHSHSLAEYVQCIHRDDWQGVGELMLSSARKLASIGAGVPDLPRQHHSPGASAC